MAAETEPDQLLALAVFMFDDDAGAWWVEATDDPDQHDPPNSVFVLEVDAEQLRQMEGHRRAWLDLVAALVAAAKLNPIDGGTVEPCPTWHGEALAQNVDDDYLRGVLAGTIDVLHPDAHEPRVRAEFLLGREVARLRVVSRVFDAPVQVMIEGDRGSGYRDAAGVLDGIYRRALGVLDAPDWTEAPCHG